MFPLHKNGLWRLQKVSNSIIWIKTTERNVNSSLTMTITKHREHRWKELKKSWTEFYFIWLFYSISILFYIILFIKPYPFPFPFNLCLIYLFITFMNSETKNRRNHRGYINLLTCVYLSLLKKLFKNLFKSSYICYASLVISRLSNFGALFHLIIGKMLLAMLIRAFLGLKWILKLYHIVFF